MAKTGKRKPRAASPLVVLSGRGAASTLQLLRDRARVNGITASQQIGWVLDEYARTRPLSNKEKEFLQLLDGMRSDNSTGI